MGRPLAKFQPTDYVFEIHKSIEKTPEDFKPRRSSDINIQTRSSTLFIPLVSKISVFIYIHSLFSGGLCKYKHKYNLFAFNKLIN